MTRLPKFYREFLSREKIERARTSSGLRHSNHARGGKAGTFPQLVLGALGLVDAVAWLVTAAPVRGRRGLGEADEG